ncbi:MAG: hypothetical protein ABI679_07305 [Gemmatimonadota bacterium]
MKWLRGMASAWVFVICGCRGQAPGSRTDLVSLVDSLKPTVERITGLQFRRPLRVETRTRDQLRAFLIEKADEKLTPERLRGEELTLKLLGLVPDSINLRNLLVDVLSEQVAGYYDPESSTLFAVEGGERLGLVILLTHEMTHALQDQYLPLDSILEPQLDDDRQAAAQAILEGQAFLVQMKAMLPAGRPLPPEFMEQARAGIAANQSSMPQFANAPLVIRQQLLYPYLAGGEFLIWWETAHPDTVPFGPRMPESSEQILQPVRYEAGDRPVSIQFEGNDKALFENTLGDFTIRVLAAQAVRAEDIAEKTTLGWGGDRFRIYDTPAGGALVWVVAWDDSVAMERFRRGTGAAIVAQSRPGYRFDMADLSINGKPATRIVIAPVSWDRWNSLPAAGIPDDPNHTQ